MSGQLNIAIIGAGIGGLALAAALATRDHRVRVFDRFDAPAPVGSGLVIQPVGQQVLHDLGVGGEAEALGKKLFRMLGTEAAQDRVVLDVTYDAPALPRFGLAIHRAALFTCLLRAAERAGAELVAGQEITGVAHGMVESADQSHGPFDLIVDASGAGSVLSPIKARGLGYGALWATVDWPADTGLPVDELRQRYKQARHMVGVLPIGQMDHQNSTQKAAIFWSLPARDYNVWRARGLAQWKEEAAALWPDFTPFSNQIEHVDQMTMARYAHGTLMRPYTRDVVFIGDAAHRASPQLGQGANMALLDAWSLAEAVGSANGDMAKAARTYAQARRWHVQAYQAMSKAFTPMYQSNSRILPVLRDRVLAPIAMHPRMRRMLTRLVCGDLLPPAQ